MLVGFTDEGNRSRTSRTVRKPGMQHLTSQQGYIFITFDKIKSREELRGGKGK